MNVLVVAPHPDDETLGCGGTIMKHLSKGDKVYWLLVTALPEDNAHFEMARNQIAEVQKAYNFSGFDWLKLPTTRLDTIPQGDLVGQISAVFKKISPDTVYVPYRGDIHSDHQVVVDAVLSCTKWFRYPSVKRVLSYETLSETEFSVNPDDGGFRPNVFIDISEFIDEKTRIFNLYQSETGAFPFPRSEKAIRALATYRGSSSGYDAAEAFMLLRERS